MESYEEFVTRIKSIVPVDCGLKEEYLGPSFELCSKVANNGDFLACFGDTITFDLKYQDKIRINEIVKKIKSRVPDIFANSLSNSRLHFTLHTLTSSDSLEDISSMIFFNQIKIRDLIRNTSYNFRQTNYNIEMLPIGITNMGNTTLSLILIPSSREDFEKLSYLYNVMNTIIEVPFETFIPHISLGYFNLSGLSVAEIQELNKAISEIIPKLEPIMLQFKRLYYQIFYSMNDFIPIMNFLEE